MPADHDRNPPRAPSQESQSSGDPTHRHSNSTADHARQRLLLDCPELGTDGELKLLLREVERRLEELRICHEEMHLPDCPYPLVDFLPDWADVGSMSSFGRWAGALARELEKRGILAVLTDTSGQGGDRCLEDFSESPIPDPSVHAPGDHESAQHWSKPVPPRERAGSRVQGTARSVNGIEARQQPSQTGREADELGFSTVSTDRWEGETAPVTGTTSNYLAGPPHPSPAVKLARQVIAEADAADHQTAHSSNTPPEEERPRRANGDATSQPGDRTRSPRPATDADNIMKALRRAGPIGVPADELMNEIAEDPTMRKLSGQVYVIQRRYGVVIKKRTVKGKTIYFMP